MSGGWKVERTPLFEIAQGELVPFRRLKGGSDIYEKQIEALVWENVEEFTGETMFPITRQARLPSGGIPDIVALDKSGRVVVFEVKRDVERGQLAQCLEYAGWARKTSLDELAGMFHGGSAAFWASWLDFTETATPVVVNPNPRLMLVAREFQDRTRSAFDFLIENKLPIKLIRVTVYEDEDGRRFVDVEGEHEPEFGIAETVEVTIDHTKINGHAIKIPDLLEAGLLVPGDQLRWARTKKGVTYEAEITENGAIRLADGRAFASPSRAAMDAANVPAYDGWYAWTVLRVGKRLNDLRHALHEAAVVIDHQE